MPFAPILACLLGFFWTLGRVQHVFPTRFSQSHCISGDHVPVCPALWGALQSLPPTAHPARGSPQPSPELAATLKQQIPKDLLRLSVLTICLECSPQGCLPADPRPQLAISVDSPSNARRG